MTFSGSAADLAAIRNLIDDYSDAVFRRDSVAWAGCWIEDAGWTLMDHTFTGRAAIVATWQGAMAGFGFVAFFAQPGAITVDGDRATGRVYTHEVLENPDGTIGRPVGRYDDRYVRVDDRWLFAERRYTLLHAG